MRRGPRSRSSVARPEGTVASGGKGVAETGRRLEGRSGDVEAVGWQSPGRLQLKNPGTARVKGRRRDYRVTTKRAACPRASRSNPSLICSRGRVSVNRRSTGNRPCLYSAM